MTNEERGRILLPLDGSKNAENAIPLAALLSKVFACDLEFFQAREPSDDGSDDDTRAAAIFDSYATARAAHFGIESDRFSVSSRVGPAAATVLDAADEAGVRGIALASHGRGGFHATVFGSVADRIIRGSRLPTLVVPGVGGPATEIAEMLVTLDGSEVAARALEPARQIAAGVGARLSLLRAYSIVSPGMAAYPYYPPDLPAQLAESARAYVKSLAQEGERSLVVQAEAASGIVAAANDLDVDLVVMSSHGKGFSKRFFAGSVTNRVMHELHRPLLIIPPERQ